MRQPVYVWNVATIALYLAAALVLGCGFRNDPPSTAPTPDDPCGVAGVPCLDMQGALSGMCCGQGFTCGGGKYSVGCPAGECCFIGSSDEDDPYGSRKPTMQWKAWP